MQESSVDVIGIINSLTEPSEIKLKSSEAKLKRTINILDNSLPQGVEITLTIWGETCFSKEFKVGDVIALKNGKVSFYGGRTLN